MHTDELWQVYDSNGERIESAGRNSSLGNPKKDSGDGNYVGAACVWLYRHNEAGEIEVLFQQRSPKVTNGGLWDVSAGGHINNGEKSVDAAVRELREEIGIKVAPADLEYIFSYKAQQRVNMFVNIYLCDWSDRPDNFKYDDGEVSQVKWVKLSDYNNFIEENAKPPLRNDFPNTLAESWLKSKQK